MVRSRRNLILFSLGAVLALGGALATMRGLGWLVELPWQRYLPGTRPPIRLGLLHSQTGSLAISEASVLEAELLAIEETNAEGGIDGRRIVPVVADCRSDPTEFALAAGRLLDREGVVALFGGWTSECRKAMIPVVEERSGLLFFPGNYEGLEQSRRVIYTGGSANQTVLPAIRWAYDLLKARRFFIVGLEEIWSRSCAEMAKDAIRAAGAEVIGESYSAPGRPAVEAAVDAIRQSKPDVVLNFLFGPANGDFYQAFRRAGLTAEATPTIAFGFSEDEARRFVLADLVGHHAGWNYFQSLDRAENLDFTRKFRARYGETRTIGDSMVAAYNAVRIWAQTAREVDAVDAEAVLNSLDRQSLDAPDGIVTIDSETRVAWRPCHVGRLRSEGQFEIIYSIPRPVRPVLYLATRPVDRWRAFQTDLQSRWGGRWSQESSTGVVSPSPVRPPSGPPPTTSPPSG